MTVKTMRFRKQPISTSSGSEALGDFNNFQSAKASHEKVIGNLRLTRTRILSKR